jgi:trigger factor
MSDLQISVETRDGLERAVRVQVPAARIDNEVAVRLQKVGRTAKIKGFRPGKVPAKVIQQRYGDQVRQEVLQDVLQSSYSEAITQEKLRPAGGPRIEPEDLEAGKDLTFTAIFEVYPEIELAALDKLAVERPVVDIGDADIDEMLESLRRQRTSWEAVDRKSGEGDQVTVDFSATLNGEPLEGGQGEKVPVVIGDSQMLPDFEKNLRGLKAGEEKKFDLIFPDDYHATHLAGQKAVFTANVTEVAAPQLPELDEDFIKTFGVESGQLDELRADVQRNMQREADAKLSAEIKQRVMEGLLTANEVAVPAVLVEQEASSLQQDAMRQIGIEDASQAPELASFRDTAERRTKLGLLVGAVINDHQIKADSAQVKAKVEEVCAPYEDPEQIAKMYYQNPSLLQSVESVVLEDQVIELVLKNAKVSDKKISFADLMGH